MKHMTCCQSVLSECRRPSVKFTDQFILTAGSDLCLFIQFVTIGGEVNITYKTLDNSLNNESAVSHHIHSHARDGKKIKVDIY